MAQLFLTDIDLNKNELQNAVVQVLGSNPQSLTPKSGDNPGDSGLIWFNSSDGFLYYYNGTASVPIGAVNFETDANNIKVAGTKSVGTLSTIPRADHVHPAQTTVSGNAGTATTLKTPRYIDGISFNGSANITHFATSGTPQATPDKSATTSTTGTDIFSLTTGAVVYVKFTYAATPKVAQVAQTLNVNQTGAKEIIIPKGYPNSGTLWDAGDTVGFVYDGTYWVAFGQYNVDTKNTAGSTDSSSKLFLVGATSQAANPQTYSQDTAYVGTDGHLYSNSKQVVNLSDSQSVSNKTFTSSTYNGHSLAAAADKGVDTSISDGSSSTNLPTSAAVASFVSAQIGAADAMRFKGTLGTGGTVTDLPTTGVKIGDTYRVITATSGTYYAGLDKDVEVGDLVIATATTPTWTVAQTNIEGAITTADASTATPIVAGTGAYGSSTKYAREDHVHPAQTSVSGNAGTASKLLSTRYIDGISFDGSGNVERFAICTTNAQVVAKKVTGITNFNLRDGAIVTIKFTEGNIASAPTLQVNDTAAKSIKYRGGTSVYLEQNTIRTFVYSGQSDCYEMVGGKDNSYSAGTAELIKQGTDNVNRVWSAKILHDYNKYSETNPALTATGGLCTWTITHNLGTQFNNVQIYRVSDGVQVMADIVATSTTVTTIKMISSADIAAGTYRVVILGAA